MSYQLKRYKQSEGGPFDTTNNKFTVQISENDASLNLAESYLDMELQLTNANASAINGKVLVGYGRGKYTAANLVQQCNVGSDLNQNLEQNKACNVLANTKAFIENSEDDWHGGEHYGAGACEMRANLAHLKVPLSDVCGLGSQTNFDSKKHPNLKFDFELDNKTAVTSLFQQDQTHPAYAINDLKCNALVAVGKTLTFTNGFTDLPTALLFLGVNDNIQVNYTANAKTYSIVTKITTLAPATMILFDDIPICTAITVKKLNSRREALSFGPFTNSTGGTLNLTKDIGITVSTLNYSETLKVGDVCKLGYRNNGNVYAQLSPATIASIAVDYAQSQWTIKFTEDLDVDAGEVVQEISLISPTPQVMASWKVNKCELVLAKLNAKVEPEPDYFTWRLEEVNVLAAATDYRHQFNLEENCVAAYIMPVSHNIGERKTIGSYRISINGEDQTNRDVVYESSLYHDMQERSFMVKNLGLDNKANSNIFVAPAPDLELGVPKVLNFRCDTIAESTLYCFKQVVMNL